ncbi:MAG: acyltransferase family protein [Paludibacteraceae bacterium]|nr:acyltransferase family protein [Paludibacteraceae bacterium]
MERIKYLDYLKAFAIYLVVYGHLLCDYADEQASSPVCITIYSFHMALFMSLSGYFFQSSLKKSFTEVLKSKAVQLLIPLVVWDIMKTIVLAALNPDTATAIVEHYIRKGGPLHGFWYLKTLFILYIANYLIYKVVKKDLVAAIVSCTIFLILPDMNFTSIMCPFFWLGYFIHSQKGLFDNKSTILFSIATIIVILGFVWKQEYAYNQKDNSPDIYLLRFAIGSAVSILLFWLFEVISPYIEKIDRRGIITKIGGCTLGIYCIHMFFYMEIFWGNALHICGNELYIALWGLVILMLCFLIVTLLKKTRITALLVGIKYNKGNNTHKTN